MTLTVPLFTFSGEDTDAAKAASASIRRHCGWHIFPVLTETFTVRGSGARDLFLPTLRLLEVVACTEDGTELDPAALTIGADFAGFVAHPSRYWTNSRRGVTVTIRHGYDYVPELAQLCRDVAARIGSAPGGQLIQKSMGDRSLMWSQVGGVGGGRPFLDSEREQILAPYRITV